MKKQLFKKFIAILVASAMIFTLGACGNKDADNTEGDKDSTEITDNIENNEDDGEIDYDEELNEESEKYDFHAGIVEKFGLMGAIENSIDESKLEENTSKIQSMLEDASTCMGKEFDFFSEYEESEDEYLDMGEQIYAVGMQPDDVEVIDAYLEGGVYLKLSEDRYYHYIDYCSKNVYEVNDADMAEISKQLKDAMGVDIPESILYDAFTKAFKGLSDDIDTFYLTFQTANEGISYKENVSIVVYALSNEVGENFAYLNCERERAY